MISRIYTSYGYKESRVYIVYIDYSRDKVYDHLEVENCVDDGSNVRNGHG